MEYGRRVGQKEMSFEDQLKDSEVRIRVGQFLKEHRKRKRLTTREVGEYVGVSSNYISVVERGLRWASDGLFSELAKLYGIDEEELFTMAGRVSPKVQEFVAQEKELQKIIRELYEMDLEEDQKAELYEKFRKTMEEMK